MSNRWVKVALPWLGPILLSIHNLTYYQRLLADARTAIEHDDFEPFCREKMRGWGVLGH